MAKSAVKPFKVQGDVFWAFLDKRNEMSNKFQFDLCNLSKAAVEKLEELGINVKENPNKPDQGKYITFKSGNFEFKAYDTDGNELKDVIIGNKTKATVSMKVYGWSFKNKKGVSPSCVKLVINELVEYNKESSKKDDDLDDSLDDIAL